MTRTNAVDEQAGANTAEKKNEELAGALLSKLNTLKSVSLTGTLCVVLTSRSRAEYGLQVTISINEEVHEQNKAIEMMQSGMGATDSL
jgi:hypothetical protein